MPRTSPEVDARRAPRRTCVGCRAVRDQAGLVRIAADGRGGAMVTPKRSAGRGAYCCPTASCLEQALRRKALPRALRRELPRLDAETLRRSLAEAARRLQTCPTGRY